MTEPTRTICELCGGVKMGPIYWVDDAPNDALICRSGRVAFSGDDVDGYYNCKGERYGLSVTSDPTTPPEEK